MPLRQKQRNGFAVKTWVETPERRGGAEREMETGGGGGVVLGGGEEGAAATRQANPARVSRISDDFSLS